MTAPFIKWAGGKGRLASRVASMVPVSTRWYFEPFLGGGAVFFAICGGFGSPRARLNDLNSDLVLTYGVVRDEPDALVRALTQIAVDYLARDEIERASYFYQIRASCPSDPIDRAARLIFLNKTCYNGLYRVNRQGGFNVPHGRYERPLILDETALLAASKCLQGSDVTSVDFEEAVSECRPGDFVYFDPPYQPLSRTSNFTSYTSQEFGHAEQIRLRDTFVRLTQLGVAAVLSNSSHPDIADLYDEPHFRAENVWMGRAINSNPEARTSIPELLINNLEAPQVRYALMGSPK